MLFLILASLFWGLSFALIKSKLVGLDPNFVAFARMFLAIPLFIPQTRLINISYKNIFILLGIGAIQYGLMFVPYILSYRYLDAYQIALLCITTPIYVTLLNDAYEKKFNLFSLLMALLSVFGVAIILYKPQGSLSFIFKGFLLVEISNVCFAFGQISYKKFRQKNPSIIDSQVISVTYFGGLIITAFATTFSGGWGSICQMNKDQMLALLYLGVVASGLAFFCWSKGATTTKPSTLAILNNLKIPIAVFISFMLLKEQANLFRLILGFIVMGVALILSEKHS